MTELSDIEKKALENFTKSFFGKALEENLKKYENVFFESAKKVAKENGITLEELIERANRS